MKPKPSAPIGEEALEPLLAATAPDQLDLALLDLAWGAQLSPAIAVWRFIRVEGASEGAWHPVRSRGPGELLPSNEMVRATLENGFDERLPGNSFVLSSCVGERCIALVLGSVADEAACDVASGLLGLHAAIAQSQGFDDLDVSPLQPPMPRREPRDDDTV